MKVNLKFTALILVLSLLTACAPAPPERQAVPSASQPRSTVSVESIWQANENIIQVALAGGPIFEDRYLEACQFFERLTGIPIRGEGTYVGWLPNEHTAEDLQAVRDWYAVNRDRLYLDAETKTVKVHPAKQ